MIFLWLASTSRAFLEGAVACLIHHMLRKIAGRKIHGVWGLIILWTSAFHLQAFRKPIFSNHVVKHRRYRGLIRGYRSFDVHIRFTSWCAYIYTYIYICIYIYMYLRPSVSISFCYSSPYAYWCVLRQGIFGIQSITTPPGVACDRSFGSSARRNLGEPGRPRRSGRSMDPWWEVSINSNKTMVYGRYIYT